MTFHVDLKNISPIRLRLTLWLEETAQCPEEGHDHPQDAEMPSLVRPHRNLFNCYCGSVSLYLKALSTSDRVEHLSHCEHLSVHVEKALSCERFMEKNNIKNGLSRNDISLDLHKYTRIQSSPVTSFSCLLSNIME